MFVRSYSTLAKKTKLCILTWTWWSQFFDFHEKRKQVHGKFSLHDIFCIIIYRCTKCTCKSKFQNDVTQFPQCKYHIKIIVLLSALFLLMGYQRIASIVGLIQIHVASLESVWLSMLHNRVSILKWHLFILSIPLLRVNDPCAFDGIIFNGTALPIYINTTCYIAYHQGHSTFVLLVEMFEVDRRNGRGHLYFGVDIILVKHLVNQQWVRTGWLVPSWAELTTIFPSMTDLFVFGQKWERPERRSSPSSRTFTIGLIHASLQPWQEAAPPR